MPVSAPRNNLLYCLANDLKFNFTKWRFSFLLDEIQQSIVRVLPSLLCCNLADTLTSTRPSHWLRLLYSPVSSDSPGLSVALVLCKVS